MAPLSDGPHHTGPISGYKDPTIGSNGPCRSQKAFCHVTRRQSGHKGPLPGYKESVSRHKSPTIAWLRRAKNDGLPVKPQGSAIKWPLWDPLDAPLGSPVGQIGLPVELLISYCTLKPPLPHWVKMVTWQAPRAPVWPKGSQQGYIQYSC